jgi:hypothetical protein
MRCRQFIAGLGSVPVVAHAQQPAMPVIGFLRSDPRGKMRHRSWGSVRVSRTPASASTRLDDQHCVTSPVDEQLVAATCVRRIVGLRLFLRCVICATPTRGIFPWIRGIYALRHWSPRRRPQGAIALRPTYSETAGWSWADTAPLDTEVILAVADARKDPYVLPQPCRLTVTGWVNSMGTPLLGIPFKWKHTTHYMRTLREGPSNGIT